MGDSLMAWHRATLRSISHSVARNLGEPVENRAISGARLIYKLPVSGAMGLRISRQYSSGDWDWVVLTGGGNDLWMGCGCNRCDRRLNKMLTPNGRGGELAKLVTRIRKSGAQVIYVGYLRSPGVDSMIEHCRDDGDEFERRVARLAAQVDGMHFLSIADMVPYGDRSFHSVDMIHPSYKASQLIGQRIAALIRRLDPQR
ncbi:MAG: GDSL family lipase [Rhodobacterales bacterium]|nr:MAG: GDSL family lipase [Rhodobacterales bacterium]